MVSKKYMPQKVTQSTGGHYRPFDNLDNVRNTNSGSYAISNAPFNSKGGAHDRPSQITVKNFKCNLPSNAVVKKITVHYRHAKRGSSAGQPVKDKYPNIPAPTVTVKNNVLPSFLNLSKKGSAPPKTASTKTMSWTGSWEASLFNSNDFQVTVNYPANTDEWHNGYLLVSFVYVTLEYYTPSYSLKGASANNGKVYNGSEYHLRLSCSDSNRTKRMPQVNMEVPVGLNFKEARGGIVRVNGRALSWFPDMTAGTGSVELVFDTDFTFSSGVSSVTVPFSFGIPSGVAGSFSDVVYKELPKTEEEGGTDAPLAPEMDAPTDIQKVYLETPFKVQLNLTEEEKTRIINANPPNGTINLVFYDDASFETVSNNAYRKYDTGEWDNIDPFIFSPIAGEYSRLDDDGYFAFDFKLTEMSRYYVRFLYSTSNREFITLKTIILDCIPQESDLTVPNFVKLELSEEELARLGDGYNYTVQSDLKLVTSETYVRDWYRNFRIGVFNNPVLANVSRYYEYNNTDTEFIGYFILSGKNDLTDATLTIDVNAPVTMEINNTVYDITTSQTIPMFETYNIPVVFTRAGADNVIVDLTLKDEDNNILETLCYHINFNAEESTDIQEITVDTTDYTNLTNEEIFTNAFYWDETLATPNNTESIDTQFKYDKNYPLYILITGDYPEGEPTQNTIQYTEPCIIETDEYTTRLPNGNYPVPIDNLILLDGSSSEITLNKDNTSATIVFYQLPLEDHYGTNTTQAVRGIELIGTLEQADRTILYARLKSPTGDSRERSVVINDYDGTGEDDRTFHIGGNGDLWGFSTLDIVDLEDWEIEFSIANTLDETEASLNFGAMQLALYIEQVTTQSSKAYINGEDIAYYGAFLTNINVPEGLETDTDYLKVDGTDLNDAYRQNIKEKEITLEFEIGEGCDLEANTLSLRELTKLLVNDRDEYNRPIPKRLELSHYPDVYWEYIMEESLDTKLEISTYTCKAKLTIPAGTSYDKETTTTSTTGYVNGIARINPTLIVKPSDEIITIKETVSGQSMSIGYSNFGTGILEINTENRTVYLKDNEEDTEPVNINDYVDYDVDWFSIIGEYAFEGVNCIIRTVNYEERW